MKRIHKFLRLEDYGLLKQGRYDKERVMVGYGYPYQYNPSEAQLANIAEVIQHETGTERDDIRYIYTERSQSLRYAGSVLGWVSVKADTVRQNFDDYKNLYC